MTRKDAFTLIGFLLVALGAVGFIFGIRGISSATSSHSVILEKAATNGPDLVASLSVILVMAGVIFVVTNDPSC